MNKIEHVCREIKSVVRAKDRTIRKLRKEMEFYKDFYNENRALVDYANTMLNTSGSLTITEFAQKYNMSAAKMNDIFIAANIFFKVGNRYHLTKEYENMGYVVPERNSHCFRYWTRKGELMLYKTLSEKGIYPVAA